MTGFRSPLPAAPPHADGLAGAWRAGRDGAGDGASGGARVPGGRRRSVPHLLAGALLVVVCAVGFVVAAGNMDHRASVLALARPVAVGQRLTSADVRSVRVSTERDVATIPASGLRSVLGQTVAMSLPAGALLTRGELGPVDLPAGQAVVAVAVKAGQAPPGLAAGEHVLLVPTTSSGTAAGAGDSASKTSTAAPVSSTGSPATPWTGVVTGVLPATGVEDATVVSVQLPAAAARVVAALPTGAVDLVLVPGS